MENLENEQVQASYWNSVTIGGFIIAIIMSVMGLVSQYMTISSEPTGAQFNMASLLGTVACLIAAVGGIISTRHYAKTYDITFPIGTGALIGFLTGAAGVILSTIISVIWTSVIDPGLNQAVYDWQIANLEAQNLPAEQMEMAMSFMPEPGSMTTLLVQAGIGLVVIGILNLVTGMIGAKLFASED